MIDKYQETIDRIEAMISKYQKPAGMAAPIQHLSDDDVELYADYMTLSGKEEELLSCEESERLLTIEDHLYECEACDRKARQMIEWRKSVEKAARVFHQAEAALQKQKQITVAEILSGLSVYFKDFIADVLNKGETLRQMLSCGYLQTAAYARGGNKGGADDTRVFISGRMVDGSFKLEIEEIIKPEEKDLYSVKIIQKDGSEIKGNSEIADNKVVYWFDNPNFEENTEYELRFELKK